MIRLIKNICKNCLFLFAKVVLKTNSKPNKEDFHHYLKNRHKIKYLYNEDLYWHGTGRYQYKTGYDIKDKNIETIDVLSGILNNKGILPLVKDPWMKSNNDYKVTISLAKIRLYASVYAFMSLYEEDKLYKYGSRIFWLFLIDMTNFFEEPIDVIKHFFIFTFKIGNKKLRQYQSKFRSRSKLANLRTFFLQLFYMAAMKSDIEYNYPIIIAIKTKNLVFLEVNTGFDYFEARVDKPIKLEDISHIQVPSKYLKETNKLLSRYNTNLPVIPIEAAEIYTSKDQTIIELLTPEQPTK